MSLRPRSIFGRNIQVRLVTVEADGHTYRRLFSYPELNATLIVMEREELTQLVR